VRTSDGVVSRLAYPKIRMLTHEEKQVSKAKNCSRAAMTILAVACWVSVATVVTEHSRAQGSSDKIFAQGLIENALKNHPEVSALEISATPPRKQQCVTIASTEAKDVGEKCDKDEFTAMRTGKPFVEKEKGGFDVTVPLHDATGKLIGTVGMDFKPQPGQQESSVVEVAQRLAQELERQVSSKAKLFGPAK
jgi:hypothetical protein